MSTSESKIESLEESTRRQKINYVKQIMRTNFNDYSNHPKLRKEYNITNFINYLLDDPTFSLATKPRILKEKIDFWLESYNSRGGSKKSKKYRKKSRKSKKSIKSKKHHKRKSRNKRR